MLDKMEIVLILRENNEQRILNDGWKIPNKTKTGL